MSEVRIFRDYQEPQHVKRVGHYARPKDVEVLGDCISLRESRLAPELRLKPYTNPRKSNGFCTAQISACLSGDYDDGRLPDSNPAHWNDRIWRKLGSQMNNRVHTNFDFCFSTVLAFVPESITGSFSSWDMRAWKVPRRRCRSCSISHSLR